MKISVIGAGKWGEALAHAFGQKCEVVISSKHKRDLPNFISIKEAMDLEYLVMAIPAQFVRQWLEEHFIDRGQKVLVASKGIEVSTGSLLDGLFQEFIPSERLAFLSGPSFAKEVMQSLPTALVVSSTNRTLAQKYVNAFPSFIKGYVDDDVAGAEVGGAYKNVIAIAGGICDGLSLGNNARAAMISRGLVEMSRFGTYYGARSESFLSLGGAGDLFLTASSQLSRNYRVGLGLAQGKSKDEIVKELKEVAEGIPTSKALFNISKSQDIYLPIANEVYKMIYESKEARKSVEDLLRS